MSNLRSGSKTRVARLAWGAILLVGALGLTPAGAEGFQIGPVTSTSNYQSTVQTGGFDSNTPNEYENLDFTDKRTATFRTDGPGAFGNGQYWVKPGAVVVVATSTWTNQPQYSAPSVYIAVTGSTTVHHYGQKGPYESSHSWTNSYQLQSNMTYTFSVSGFSLFGFYSILTANIGVDSVPPTLSPRPVANEDAGSFATGSWINALSGTKAVSFGQPLRMRLNPMGEDVGGSGLASLAYRVTDASGATKQGWTSVANGSFLSYPAAGNIPDGVYKLWFRSIDLVENMSETSMSYQVDTAAPLFEGNLQLKASGLTDEGGYQSLVLSWPPAQDPVASDGSRSGFQGYRVQVGSVITLVGPEQRSLAVPMSSLRTGVGNLLKLSVAALDGAGNETVLSLPDYELPPQIQVLASAGATLASLVNPPFLDTRVTIPLAIAPVDFLQYSTVTFQRDGVTLPESSGLPGSTFTVVPASVVTKNVDGAYVSLDPAWSVQTAVDSNGLSYQYMQFQETIGPKFGIGGRELTYSVVSETLAIADPATGPEQGGAAQTLTLPARPGTMLVEVLDLQGNKVSVAPDGTITGDPEALVVDSKGRVLIRFTGTGIDADPWTASVHQKIAQDVGGGITNLIDMLLGGADSQEIAYRYDPVTFNAETNQYPAFSMPVTLSYGDNNIRVEWYQGADPSHGLQTSKFVVMNYSQDLNGLYRLRLTTSNSPTVRQSDDGAIVVSPGQPVTFSLEAENEATSLETVSWDFGDSSIDARATGANPTHVYHQVKDAQGRVVQTSDSVRYTIVISQLPSSADARLPIVVQDTQAGALYESEVWNGPHTITGNVLVPAGLSLTVGTNVAVPTSVTFAGGVMASSSQGMTVKGQLLVGQSGPELAEASGVSVVFAPDPDYPSVSGQRWGTLLIEGSATLRNAVVTGGQRGITTGPAATAQLLGVTLTGNVIGLHVFGNTQTTVSGSILAGNRFYGVKEDSGGRPVMLNNTIKANGVDYYQNGLGAITIEQLNQLTNGNMGNHR